MARTTKEQRDKLVSAIAKEIKKFPGYDKDFAAAYEKRFESLELAGYKADRVKSSPSSSSELDMLDFRHEPLDGVSPAVGYYWDLKLRPTIKAVAARLRGEDCTSIVSDEVLVPDTPLTLKFERKKSVVMVKIDAGDTSYSDLTIEDFRAAGFQLITTIQDELIGGIEVEEAGAEAAEAA